jgi:hypothetical protein
MIAVVLFLIYKIFFIICILFIILKYQYVGKHMAVYSFYLDPRAL